MREGKIQGNEISLTLDKSVVKGFLSVPKEAKGIVLFAHGSGSSRFSPRNQYVARVFDDEQLATLVLDLLTEEEELAERETGELRFDISLLSKRLVLATDWVSTNPKTHHLPIGYFGASTGAAAALLAATEQPALIKAVVSRGGRPDLAAPYLPKVIAPTLLIVGGNDSVVLNLNERAYDRLSCEKKLEVIPNATHLFEESGALEEVGRMAKIWFVQYL